MIPGRSLSRRPRRTNTFISKPAYQRGGPKFLGPVCMVPVNRKPLRLKPVYDRLHLAQHFFPSLCTQWNPEKQGGSMTRFLGGPSSPQSMGPTPPPRSSGFLLLIRCVTALNNPFDSPGAWKASSKPSSDSPSLASASS